MNIWSIEAFLNDFAFEYTIYYILHDMFNVVMCEYEKKIYMRNGKQYLSFPIIGNFNKYVFVHALCRL